jgi:adenylosuccinate lyase
MEAEEPFRKGQKGSSAMPHKRNPIICERVAGQARVIRTNAMAALENMPLWHERDISHSSVERIIVPDSTILLDYMIDKFTKVMKGLNVYPENMKKNLEKIGGLIFSQAVMLKLTRKGLTREEAYDVVQRSAMQSWRSGESFRELISTDEDVKKHLSEDEIEKCFDLSAHLRNIDYIFERAGIQ